MKFVVDGTYYKHVCALQQVFDVTVVSDKGLVFMYRDDWQRICGFISEFDEGVYKLHHKHNPLMDNYNMWAECFLVIYDKSEDYSAHTICNFEQFHILCRAAGIPCVLLPMYDLTRIIPECNAHDNKEALGCYLEHNGDQIIEVEDN